MGRRLPTLATVSVLLASLALCAAPGGATAAKPTKGSKRPRTVVFEVCRHGCRQRTIQGAVDAAGAYSYGHRRPKVKVVIQPGNYEEGVVLDGAARRLDFDGMTIEGAAGDRRRTILDGRKVRREESGIEAIDVSGLVLKNLWARNFAANGFYVRGSGRSGTDCGGYTMSNLVASGNGLHGFLARDCVGGKIINSAGYHQGVSAFSVEDTPCENARWNVYGGTPCRRRPQVTLLRDDEGYENPVGFSGGNAKYVFLGESAFFDNGTGIVLDTGVSGGNAPDGWNTVERNDVFWNNYDPFLAAASHLSPAGLGGSSGLPLSYPTVVGIVLDGTDHDVVAGNRVFGNYKWGIASTSGADEATAEGGEAKSVGNEIFENVLGREGADPNGEYDFWNDGTVGGNCWGANSSNSTFAPIGRLATSQLYPVCPPAEVGYAAARVLGPSGSPGAALPEADGSTFFGYVGIDPPQNQQCSWVRRGPHPPFQTFEPVEVTPRPGELDC